MSFMKQIAGAYGSEWRNFTTKNNFDLNGKYVECSRDRTGYDFTHGIVKKFHTVNSKMILFAPVGPLKLYRSSLPKALEAIKWGVVQSIIIGRKAGQWYILVKCYRIATPGIANTSALQLQNYLSVAVDSRMEIRRAMFEELYPCITFDSSSDPTYFTKRWGALLRQRGFGREIRTVESMWDDFDEEELKEKLDDFEFLRDVEEAEMILQEEEDIDVDLEPQVMIGDVEMTPARPTSASHLKVKRKRKRTPHQEQVKTVTSAKKLTFGQEKKSSGPVAFGDQAARRTIIRSFTKGQRGKDRLRVVNYKRGLDPHDFIYSDNDN